MNNNLDGAPLMEERLEDNRHLLALKKAYHQLEIPMDAAERLKDTIHEVKTRKRRRSWLQGSVTVFAAACLCILLLLNSSATIAEAMSKIPGIGGLFEVVTFRHYENATDDYYAKVDIPKIVYYGMDESESITEINQEIKGYVESLISKFESDIKVNENIHQSMDVTYHVILNNDHWFSLGIDVFEAEASSSQHTLFYHIDKSTGEVIQLKDLFLESSDYISVISEEVKRQMKENIKNGTDIYLFDGDIDIDDFKIDENQSFYFNDSQDIVIHFDDYEIAPGSEGSKDFVIPKEAVKDILK
ncbi:DUF3298 and DUF4163 domain-containing protein [Lachnoclostridium sp.]|uniref:DUF3298 and DUF4163 domain-containing protein n=1 Tax=Lachnoclostridium sp. TaxID=2028282 RepID=UPI0028A0F61A|nr:DUF3298 domain-containing protein [Lachnoclostridium sp.]